MPPRGTKNLHKSNHLYSILLGTQRPLLTHTHKNKALACIPPARSWLLLRVMASRGREGYQPARQTVLFLILLQKMGPLGPFLVASRKHRPHHSSIHLYTPRPGYISQRPLLIHTTHKNKALASDRTKPSPASHQLFIEADYCCDSWQAGLVKVVSRVGRQFSSWSSYRRRVRRTRFSWRAESADRILEVSRHRSACEGLNELGNCDRVPRNNGVEADKRFFSYAGDILYFGLFDQLPVSYYCSCHISVPASPDQGHDRLCRRGVGRVFLAGVRPDSPSRRRILLATAPALAGVWWWSWVSAGLIRHASPL